MSQKLPLFTSPVQAGFPSFAEDQIETNLSFDELLVKHPQATFLVKVNGDSMKDAGIFEGDILVVDRSVNPTNGKVVIAVVNNDFTVKYFFERNGEIELRPANKNYHVFKFSPRDDLQIWGVVIGVVRKL